MENVPASYYEYNIIGQYAIDVFREVFGFKYHHAARLYQQGLVVLLYALLLFLILIAIRSLSSLYLREVREEAEVAEMTVEFLNRLLKHMEEERKREKEVKCKLKSSQDKEESEHSNNEVIESTQSVTQDQQVNNAEEAQRELNG